MPRIDFRLIVTIAAGMVLAMLVMGFVRRRSATAAANRSGG